MSLKYEPRTRLKKRPICPPESRIISALVFIVGITLAALMFGFVALTFFPVLLLK